MINQSHGFYHFAYGAIYLSKQCFDFSSIFKFICFLNAFIITFVAFILNRFQGWKLIRYNMYVLVLTTIVLFVLIEFIFYVPLAWSFLNALRNLSVLIFLISISQFFGLTLFITESPSY